MKNSRYSIFFISLTLLCSVHSQTDHHQIDSLLQLVSQFGNKNQDSSLHYAEKAYRIAHKENDTFLIASTGYYYSYYLISLKRNKEAEQILAFNLRHQKLLPDVLVGNSYYNKAAIYDLSEQFDTALENYFLSLEHYKIAKNKKGQSRALLQIGVIYEKLNKKTVADYFFDSSLIASGQSTSRHMVDSTVRGLSAEEKTVSSLKMLNEIENGTNEKLKAIVYYNLATSMFEQGKFTEAINYFRRSIKIKEDIRFLSNVDKAYFYLGQCFFNLENYEEAILHFNTALKINEKRHKSVDIENYLAKSYELQKNYKKALEHAKSYALITDSINAIKEYERIAEITAKYETEKQANEILTLKQENQEKELLIFQKEKNLWKWSLFALLATFASIYLGRKLISSLKRIKMVEEEKDHIAKKVEEISVILNNKTKVYLDTLKYIKSDGNYLEFVTNDKTIIDRNKLKDILDDLPPNFVRVHRSYVINKNFIDALNSTTLFLKPNIEIPLSRTFKSNLA